MSHDKCELPAGDSWPRHTIKKKQGQSHHGAGDNLTYQGNPPDLFDSYLCNSGRHGDGNAMYQGVMHLSHKSPVFFLAETHNSKARSNTIFVRSASLFPPTHPAVSGSARSSVSTQQVHRSPVKQQALLPPAIDRFSDPNCAALRHSTEARFGSHRRSHHANQQPTQAAHPVDGPMR
jgi:hypothetical protein